LSDQIIELLNCWSNLAK